MTDTILQQLATSWDTPCFVFDIDALRDRMREIKSIVGTQVELCYSIKANPFLIEAMQELVSHLEVCSPGELSICENLNVNMQSIIFSGVTKTAQDIAAAVADNVGIFTAESPLQLALINAEAMRQNKVLPVLLRLTSGNQFGMSEDTLCKLVAMRADYTGIEIKGIHFFSGTQKKKSSAVLSELCYLQQICERLKSQYTFSVEQIEYGPGLAVPYFTTDDFCDTLQLLKEISPALHSLAKTTKVTIEMGRFFTAACGYYLTRVVDTKENCGTHYCILDGGMHHVNYYGQTMGMKIPIIRHFSLQNDEAEKDWALCGSLCTVADVLVRKVSLKGLSLGNLLVFCNIGAYSVTEGSYLFLSRKMPRVILFSTKDGVKLARDFFSTDILNINGGYHGRNN